MIRDQSGNPALMRRRTPEAESLHWVLQGPHGFFCPWPGWGGRSKELIPECIGEDEIQVVHSSSNFDDLLSIQ